LFWRRAEKRALPSSRSLALGSWLLFIAPCASLGQPLQPAKIFGDNLVLQRSARTVIWGWGGTNKMFVSVKYGRASSYGTADEKGNWHVELDLNRYPFDRPDTLEIGVGRKVKEPSVRFNNVVVGDVWLLAAWGKQGLESRSGEDVRLYRDRIHFLNLASPAALARWGSYEDYLQAEDHSVLATHLATAFAKSTQYVGIVQVAAADLRAGLDPSRLSQSSGQDWREAGPLQEAWTLANEDVRREQAQRYDQRIEAKREGKVYEIRTFIEYAPLFAQPQAAFLRTQAPAAWLTFKGAIYPEGK
jgi:hypothetical protein